MQIESIWNLDVSERKGNRKKDGKIIFTKLKTRIIQLWIKNMYIYFINLQCGSDWISFAEQIPC